jgi:hypothetical protein
MTKDYSQIDRARVTTVATSREKIANQKSSF